MHDIRAIRENPAAFVSGWSSRGVEGAEALVADILRLDGELRAAQTTGQEALAKRNAASKLIGAAMAKKDMAEAERLKAEVENLKGEIATAEKTEAEVGTALRDLLAAQKNLAADDVPEGEDESGNVLVGEPWGTPRQEGPAKDHADLGEAMGLLDFEAAARMSGSRFAVLKGGLARLERAIGQFMLDVQTNEHGYLEVNPPLLVNDAAAYGTDKLPKFADDLFHTTDGRWLIPTAEVSLTATVMGQLLSERDLQTPIRMTALTPCFRAEAGSAGRDTRGLIRQHQFYKVEMVSITRPEDSDAEHERMTACAEAILRKLELPFRRLLLCKGDMGFGARKTFDLEVWLPSQGTYREISSCSNCGDFQARRMDARFKRDGEKKTEFVHTLNGSGLAVGRTLVAVMENYQDGDGRIAVPAALLPYMGGVTHVG
ncbi:MULTISPECIES: serine--tRNA ligase [unclassified Brevundimonas]|uniref:serine--tRNA ligase n=1 Tax=unclassified Brevundimonas TaxID=2622653 RepID=UPI0006FE1328|nr:MULTISPECIES: serine--tRNA ligase [unclassified Brevundimonas]KQY78284.1 serine--tRNA ligase [Brevundimonas sp. Root1423]KRA27021.1 serine--tRNA ligase [Brevundimonas sp. Root608]